MPPFRLGLALLVEELDDRDDSLPNAIRQRILNEPELFLKAQRQREPTPPTASTAALLGDLQAIVALAERANRRLAGGTEMGMTADQCGQAHRQLARAIDDLNRLSFKIPREEQEHVFPHP